MNSNFLFFTESFSYFTFQLQRTINTIGLHFFGQKVNLPHEIYISILNRIYINIFSINHLSSIFYKEQVSSSIAILFRACFSDIILGHYLLTFINDNKTFKNETLILNQSFVKKYVNDIYLIEQKLMSKNDHDYNKRIREINEIIKNEFAEILIDEKILKTKSAKMIREEFASNRDLFKKEDVYNQEPSEALMFKHLFSLSNDMIKYYEQIKILWKYFSQFQHYTFPGRHFVNDKKESFLLYFFQALINNYDFVNIIVDLIFQLEMTEFILTKKELVQNYEKYLVFMRNKKPEVIASGFKDV